MPFIPPKWEIITELKELNELSKTDETVPPLTICTGRPMPYAEAVYQWMGMYKPFCLKAGEAFMIWLTIHYIGTQLSI